MGVDDTCSGHEVWKPLLTSVRFFYFVREKVEKALGKVKKSLLHPKIRLKTPGDT